MSISERKEEAEAVLDSAEMVLETVPGPKSGKAKELEQAITRLEQELQDPDSESSLKELIEEIRDLMDEVQEDAMDEDPVMGPEDEMGGGVGGPGDPGDDVPPF
ncbi:MAG: hypothetical protein ABEJ98_01940 [Candidatus Nanohaloarchaea archaeon]